MKQPRTPLSSTFSLSPHYQSDCGESNLPSAGWASIDPTPGEIGKNTQLFSFWDPATTYIPENIFSVSLFQKSLRLCGGQLWEIVANSIESRIFNTATNLPPTRRDEIFNSPPNIRSRYSIYTARVTLRDGSGYGHVIEYDIGGGAILETFAQSADIEILGPPNTFEISDNNFDNNPGSLPTAPENTIVVNGIVSGAVNPINVPRGASSTLQLKLTKYLIVPIDAVGFVKIPPGAREVEVRQTTLAPATTNFDFIAGSSAAFPIVGVIPLVNNQSTRIFIPNGAQYISSGPVNGAAERRFSIVFRIDH